jgi:hypothetical protein
MPRSSQKPSIPHLQVDRGRAIALSPESEDSFSLAAESSPGSQRSFGMDAESDEGMGVPPTPEAGPDVELQSSTSEQSYGMDQSPPPQSEDDMQETPSPQSSQYSFGIESAPLPEDLEHLMLAQALPSASSAAEVVALRVNAPTLPDASSVVGSPAEDHTKTREPSNSLSAAPSESYYQ